MSSVRPLPAREPPLDGESLASLVRRNSVAMGYGGTRALRVLLGEVGDVPFHMNHLPAGPVLDRLSSLLAVRSDELLKNTFHTFATSLMIGLVTRDGPGNSRAQCDSKTILKYFASASSPICAACLGEDRDPHDRLVWSLRALPVCLVHRVVLIETCPACGRAIRAGRDHTAKCKCDYQLPGAVMRPLSTEAFNLANRLFGWFHKKCSPWNTAPYPEFLFWTQRIASAVSGTPAWFDEHAERFGLDPAQDHELLAWLSATEMLVGWPDRFMEFLDVFQTVAKHNTNRTGVARRFGLLLREASGLEEKGLAQPAHALRQYLTERYTGGHINTKTSLFRDNAGKHLLNDKAWISQTEASKLLNVSQRAMSNLVRQGAVEGHLHDTGSRGRTIGLVSRASLDEFQREIASTLTVNEAADRLGLGKHRVLELIKDNLLPGSLTISRAWRIPRRSTEQLLKLYQSFDVHKSHSDDWLTARISCRNFSKRGVTLTRIIRLLLDGRLDAARLTGHEDYRGLLISQQSLRTQLPTFQRLEHECNGYPLFHLTRQLFPGRPIKEPLFKKWISAGLLDATRKGRSTIVSVESVSRFRTLYCLADEACRLLEITRATLSRWESDGRVIPVYGPRVRRDAGVSLYRRADVDRLRSGRLASPPE